MKVFEANITYQVSDYFISNLKNIASLKKANQKIYEAFGLMHFFDEEEDLQTLIKSIYTSSNIISEPDRAEYGDFQTNAILANNVARHLTVKKASPEIIIEPTCGKGNFIIASLLHFKNINTVIGVEIYKPYVWECKFNIIDFYLKNPRQIKPDISIIHNSVYDYDFQSIAIKNSNREILILGNPPWVTNSKLGSLKSSNLPKKINFKNHSGLDAMTGKGNFDIAEHITLKMIETFQNLKGRIALLVKNTVIKNIIFDQYLKKYSISVIEKHCIDSKKEFNASVEASLLYCQLNSEPAFYCTEFDFYNNSNAKLNFGWLSDKFVSNTNAYSSAEYIDGKCPFEWRQGIKHDCSTIMELDKVNGHYLNGLNEEIKLENDLVYGILKSSDLKNIVISEPRKYTIVTQKKIGQETSYIKYDYPETYKYLSKHQDIFNSRKSSIYKNKPLFSIFGVGDYSFKLYKVAISGFYKTFHFTLILPQEAKPVMLDDTCYMVGFDKLEFAAYLVILLNLEATTQFLQSVTFADAKRTFTKDILMRIDLLKLIKHISKSELQRDLNYINKTYNFQLTLDLWDDFIREMMPVNSKQMELFA